MKKYEKYIEWAGTLILLLIPCFCFADTTFFGYDFGGLTFTPPASDVSVGYLAKIFGYVPGIVQLASAGKTLLGTIFYVFNIGVFAISGMFLGYTTFKIITEMTTDGTSMAKSTTMFTVVRVGSATALLMPNAANGYSLVNTFIMWIVIQSIGLADQTWNAALNYLKTGAPVTAATTTYMVDYSLVDPLMYSGNTTIDNITDSNADKAASYIGSADVLRTLVCSYSVKAALNKALTAAGSTAQNIAEFSTYKHFPAIPPKGKASNYIGGYYQFPYVTGVNKTSGAPYSGYLTNNPSAATTIAGLPINGICGTISYVTPQPSGTSVVDYGNFSKVYVPAKQSGLQTMIDTLDSVAQQLVAKAQTSNNGTIQLQPGTYVVLSGTKPTYFTNVINADYSNSTLYASKLSYTDFYTECKGQSNCPESGQVLRADKSATGINWPLGTTEILTAAAAYQAGMTRAAIAVNPNITANISQSIADAKGKGWLLAGSYYMLLEQALQTSQINYDYYKLAVSADTANAKSNRLTSLTYDPFFTSRSAIANVFTTLDRSGSSFDILNRTLAWIHFSVPYAKILGTTLNISTGTNLTITPAHNYLVWTTTDLAAIDVQLVAGCVLIALPGLFTKGLAVAMLTGVPIEYLWADVNQVMSKWNEVMGGNSPTTDPIVKLQLLGQQMIQSSLLYLTQIQGFFIGTSLAFIINSAIMSAVTAIIGAGSFLGFTIGATVASQAVMQVTNEINEIMKTVIAMYLPIGLAVVSPLLLTGITLAVYVPLIPYMLFLFAAMSWFISVIVIMAAAPIICFLMIWGGASQDNPLLSREAEDYARQLISVFFKPILMIIGLVVGVVLARIGVDVLNLGFQTVLNNVIAKGGVNTNSNLVMIEGIGAVVIYTFTMVSLVNICFSAIHLLHNEVMTVVGMRVIAGAGIEEKAMGEVKAGGQQFAEAGVAGAKDQAQALKGLAAVGKVETYAEAAQKDKDIKEEKAAALAAKSGGAGTPPPDGTGTGTWIGAKAGTGARTGVGAGISIGGARAGAGAIPPPSPPKTPPPQLPPSAPPSTPPPRSSILASLPPRPSTPAPILPPAPPPTSSNTGTGGSENDDATP